MILSGRLVRIGRTILPVPTLRVFLKFDLGQLPRRRRLRGKPACPGPGGARACLTEGMETNSSTRCEAESKPLARPICRHRRSAAWWCNGVGGEDRSGMAAAKSVSMCRRIFGAVHESGFGPTRTTWAVQQVVGYLGYSGRSATCCEAHYLTGAFWLQTSATSLAPCPFRCMAPHDFPKIPVASRWLRIFLNSANSLIYLVAEEGFEPPTHGL
jgi:hypothetical protein